MRRENGVALGILVFDALAVLLFLLIKELK
jgi:hypothetical protein